MSGFNKILLILLFLTLHFPIQGQEAFRVMFYNVENLYDTINNPLSQDDDFTPQGKLHWNSYRYHKKLEDVSKVISSVGGKYPPAIVGLCEIENEEVIKDLTNKSSLAKHKYKYLITQSKDARGSNIALLYQRDQIKLISKKSYTPIIDNEEDRTTRDILHMTGLVVNGDTLDIFVCHYPSRSEGIRKSNPFRIQVSRLLRAKVDNLLHKRANPHIIVMGDFNDYPHNESIKEILGAKPIEKRIKPNDLYNLFFSPEKQELEIASYKYKAKWGYLDQFVVSGIFLLNKNEIHIINNSASVYAPQFLLDYDEKHGGLKPFRTYSGWKYLGGFSDHLPIYFDLYIKEPQ